MENTIVLTGGGTAGHVTLNINLKDALLKHFSKIIYIGSKNGIENELIKKNTSYIYHSITTVKFERNKLLKTYLIPLNSKKESMKLKKSSKNINQT